MALLLQRLLADLQQLASGNFSFRIDAYLNTSGHLHSLSSNTSQLCQEMAFVISKHKEWIAVLKADIIDSPSNNSPSSLNNAALHFTGWLLAHADLVANVNDTQSRDFFTSLLSIVLKKIDLTETKVEQATALWTLHVQKLPPTFIEPHLAVILPRIFCVINQQAMSISLAYGGLLALASLVSQFPQTLLKQEKIWGPLVLQFITHSARRFRAAAIEIMRCSAGIHDKMIETVQFTVDQLLEPKLVPELKQLVHQHDKQKQQKPTLTVTGSDAMDIWSIIVKFLGKAIHKSNGQFKVMNLLLQVPSLAIQSQQYDAVYRNWPTLIDNFALSSTFICKSSALRVLMGTIQVGLLTEEITLSDEDRSLCLSAWHHLISRLCAIDANNNHVSTLVIEPMLPIITKTLQNAPVTTQLQLIDNLMRSR